MDSLVICKDTEFSFNISSSYVNAVWNNSFSDLSYSGVASNLGENLITVIAKDENGCYSNDTIILKVVDCTSIDEFSSKTTIFPNPTTGQFIVQDESLNNDIQKIKLVDLQGRIIQQRKGNYNNGILKEKFDLSDFVSGIYLIELLTLKGKAVKKVILN